MKAIFGLFLLVAFTAAADTDLSLENIENMAIDDTIIEMIQGALECGRKIIKEGNSTIGIPPLDPFELQGPLTVPLDLNIISGSATVSNVKLEGISTFNSTIRSSISILPLKYTITIRLNIETLKFATDYLLDILFLVTNLKGNGNTSITIGNITVLVGIDAHITGQFLRNPNFVFSFDTSDVKITGLHNDEKLSDIISRQLASTVKAIIDEQQEVITSYGKEIIGNFVQNITLLDLVGGGTSLTC